MVYINYLLILISITLSLFLVLYFFGEAIFDNLNLTNDRLHVSPPLSYLEFNYLVKNSKAVITDSGGITEETTVLGIPCITIRNNTERPETIDVGTNELIGTDTSEIKPILDKLFSNNWKKGSIPELWDGMTSKRIVDIFLKLQNEETFYRHNLYES